MQSFTVNGEKRTLLSKSGAPDYESYAEFLTGIDADSTLLAERSVNVAVFRNLTVPTVRITTGRENLPGVTGSASNGGIAAFQIVPTGQF